MNRRGLFKLIGGALCAASIEITGIKPKLPVINSAYHDAWYEMVYVMHPDMKKLLIPSVFSNTEKPRYNFENGKWIEVHKYL